jgi:catechol 2,3-dioxygenase-like lactoylglutathione lyase family enzyme
MDLGAFSVSLSVADLDASRAFYEKLGFAVVGGEANQNWLILRNGDHTIGLFQGMFEENILTFNPGWDQHANKLAEYTDVRDLQAQLQELGLNVLDEVDATTTGPAGFTVTDPDGNLILIDQHV